MNRLLFIRCVGFFILGLLTIFSFSPYRLFWLMPILFSIILYAQWKNVKYSVYYAYFWGFGVYVAHNYWINIAMHDIFRIPLLYSVSLTLLLPAYLAIYPALAVAISNRITQSKFIKLIWVMPIVWTITEYIRENSFMGFGWGALGYSQIPESPLTGYAPIGGIALVTYFTVLIAALLLCLFVFHSWLRKIASLLILLCILLFGVQLKEIQFTYLDGQEAKVGLVQGNISQQIKFDKDIILKSIDSYVQYIDQYPDLDLILYPETSIPIVWQGSHQHEIKDFIEKAIKNHTSLGLGMFHMSHDKNKYLNTVIAINPDLLIHDQQFFPFYAKNHLVPFGEFIPFPNLLEKIYYFFNIDLGTLAQGGKNQYPLMMANMYIAFNICYEEAFGEELIRSAREANLLANSTNMAWYGSSYAMDLQLQQSQARAIELGRFMVRATNTGITAIIDNHGNLISTLPRDTEGILTGKVYGYKGLTPYMAMGGSQYILWMFCIILAVIYLYSVFFIKKKK